MGIFYEQTQTFNRAPVAITIRFDGQDINHPPGEFRLPKLAVPYGKNQNPIMGSQDPTNPHISGGRYLLVDMEAPEDEGLAVPLTKEEWEEHLNRPCRLDEQMMFNERYGNDPKARLVVHGKGRNSSSRSRHDAGGAPKGLSTFEKDR